MDTLWTIISEPFTWGLGLGLLIAAFIMKSSMTAKKTLRSEINRLQAEGRDLQGHLNTQLKVNAAGTESLEKELKELRTQNENLRVNLATLQNKPGRAEARQLQVMETAVSIMREQAPGFAPVWEQALQRSETEYEAGEGGLKKLMRKVIPGIGHSGSTPSGDDDAAKNDD
jgi:chromosome segregation ATPase